MPLPLQLLPVAPPNVMERFGDGGCEVDGDSFGDVVADDDDDDDARAPSVRPDGVLSECGSDACEDEPNSGVGAANTPVCASSASDATDATDDDMGADMRPSRLSVS